MKLLRRIRYLLNRGRLERELRDEMSAHRAMLATDRKTSFGSDLRLREESRDAWGWNWLDQLRQDLAYGTRQLRRAPGFTFTVVSILALGAGLNLAAFHIFNATYHSRISLRDADSLLRFVRQSRSSRSNTFPYGAIAFYRDNSTVFSYVVTETSAGGVLAEDGPARSTFVSETYFPDLGVVPALGRLLDVRDSQPNAPPSVVLGYRFWQNKYGGDSEIAGKKIRLNDKSVEIVGVAPANFDGLAPRGTALWFPMTARPYLIEGGYGPADLSRADTAMYAKLKPGVPVAQAEAQLGLLTVELRNRSSITLEGEDVVRGESLLSARADLGRGRPVALLASLVFLILLSACANLGNVLLARGLARQRELQTRVAVGAGR